MPIRAYFEPLRPRLSIHGGLSGSNGITVTGPVLEGRMSVDEALVLSWIRGTTAAASQPIPSAPPLVNPGKPAI